MIEPSPQGTHRLVRLEVLPEEGAMGFTLPHLDVLVVSVGGRHYAYENRCPHRGVSLDWAPERFLSDDGQYVQCATHGALFERETGRCVQGPCLGDRLRPLELSEQDGHLCVLTE